MRRIIQQQRKITEASKKLEMKKLYQVLVVIDDFADTPQLHKPHGALDTLFIRGRHMQISTWVSSQKLRLISAAVRVNMQFLCCWRLRNQHELYAVLLDGYAGQLRSGAEGAPHRVLLGLRRALLHVQGLSLLFVKSKTAHSASSKVIIQQMWILRKFVGFARCGHSPSACTSARVFRLLQYAGKTGPSRILCVSEV